MLGKDRRGMIMKEKRMKGVKYSRNKIEIKQDIKQEIKQEINQK